MSGNQTLVPAQRFGGFSNNSASINCESASAAIKYFEHVKERLNNINGWSDISNGLAHFQLTDSSGQDKTGLAEKGNHIKIKVPGSALSSTSDFEWVVIEAIEHTKKILQDFESLAILVRPSEDPLNSKKAVAHFFSDDATSTFIVVREKNKIKAGIFGRNEHPNTDVKSFTDIIRNIIFNIGAILGFSKIQWKSLIHGLLGDK